MIKKTDRLITLMDEIAIAKSRLEPHDTGHIYTSISWLQHRVEEVKKEIDGAGTVTLDKNLWDAT